LTELEKIGLIPRSIVRMLDRFYYQIYLGTAEPLVKQFRFSKYLLLTSVKSLFVVLFIPFFINIFTKIYVFRPLVEYFWDTKQTEIFLNYELQEKAFTEIRNFEEKIYFDYLLKTSEGPHFQGGFTWPQNENKPTLNSFVVFEGPTISKPFFFSEACKKEGKEGRSPSFSPTMSLLSSVKLCLTDPKADTKNSLKFDSTKPRLFFLSNSINSRLEIGPVNFQVGPNLSNFERNGEEWLPGRSTDSISPGGAFYFSKNTESIFRQKTRELADHYNKESISALTNLLADFMGLIILLILLINMKMSLMNTTAFLSESFFSLKDSKKAFLMLLFTDLLVGFHSPRGWEVIFHFLFEHFGLPENHNIIFLLVGTFPVLLDALFKYWIFRHLNRHSPATVATFQAMVE
jgi:hypothetical protein